MLRLRACPFACAGLLLTGLASGCVQGLEQPVASLTPEQRREMNPGELVLRPTIELPPRLRAWDSRDAAADSLGRIGVDAVPALVQSLGHPDPEVRAYAARGLAVAGPVAVSAVPNLAQLVAQDQDEDVRRSAARALGQIGPPARDAIPSLIQALQRSPFDSGPVAPSAPRGGPTP